MGTPDKYARQEELELDGFNAGITRYLNNRQKTLADKHKDNLTLAPEASLMRDLLTELETRIAGGLRGRCNHKTVEAKNALRRLPAGRLAYLTLRHLLNIPQMGGLLSVQKACVMLGGFVESDLEYAEFQKAAAGYLSKVEESLTTAHLKHRLTVLSHARHKVKLRDTEGNVKQVGIPDLDWDDEMKYRVGAVLLNIVKKSTDMIEDCQLPFERQKFKPFQAVRLTDKYRRILATKSKLLEEAAPLHYPMIVAPRDWEGAFGGGFRTNYKSLKLKLIRSRIQKRLSLFDEVKPQRALDAINLTQRTPFKINKPVLDVLEYAVEHAWAGLSPWEKEAILPPKFWSSDDELARIQSETPQRFIDWKAERAEAYDQWHRDTTKRINARMQVNLARRFQEEPEIYFVWNLDWRGRLYPVQEYINPQGDDPARSLLLFANGKRLGEAGSYWLAVHCANCWGEDKIPNDDRERWAMENSDWIEAVAADPFSNRQWEDADKPFQFLAAAFEWAGFVREGYDFVTHLPIQMDGTCSGLQHYAGMLRDPVGGAAVNLTPGKKPSDVYAQGAEIAVSILKTHLKEGGDRAEFAQEWLNLGVDRSVAKRNIMTVCYGATLRGFADQLYTFLKKKKKTKMFRDAFKACSYLAKVMWEAISRLLVKARQGMDYLQEIARFIAKNELEIRWTTPVGLPVVQDYLKAKVKRIETIFGATKVKVNLKVDTKDKDSRRAGNAIAPNLIHSFDSAHLMLTALAMADQGLTDFSFIHDSFGCHAPDVPTMNRIIRDEFVKMYSVNRLQMFTDEIRSQLPESLHDEFDEIAATIPEMGQLDLNGVRRSAYFFN